MQEWQQNAKVAVKPVFHGVRPPLRTHPASVHGRDISNERHERRIMANHKCASVRAVVIMNLVLGIYLVVLWQWGNNRCLGSILRSQKEKKCLVRKGFASVVNRISQEKQHNNFNVPLFVLRGGGEVQIHSNFDNEENFEVGRYIHYTLATVFRVTGFTLLAFFLFDINKKEESFLYTSLMLFVMYIYSVVAARQLPLERQDGIIRTSILSNLKQLILPDTMKQNLFAPNHAFIRNFMGFSLATILANDFVLLVASFPYFERILLKDYITWKMNYQLHNPETLTFLLVTFTTAFLWLYKLFSSTFNVSYDTMTFPLISLCLLYSNKPWSPWIQNHTLDNTLNLLFLISSFVPLMITWAAIEKRLEQVQL